MSAEFRVLGTHPIEREPVVDQCILPLVVLFSIAAQQNQAGTRMPRAVPRYNTAPGAVPGVRRGMGVAPRTFIAPARIRPGVYASRFSPY